MEDNGAKKGRPMSNELPTSLGRCFGDLLDPRAQGRCDHKLLDIIIIAICGALRGEVDLYAFRDAPSEYC